MRINGPVESYSVIKVQIRDVQKKEGDKYVPTGEREIAFFFVKESREGKVKTYKESKITFKMSSFPSLIDKTDEEIQLALKGSLIEVTSTLDAIRLK